MKQTDRLLNHLKLNGRITPMESWSKLGIYRLSARIADLRKDGWAIESSRTKVLNRWGEPCMVADYVLHTTTEQGVMAL